MSLLLAALLVQHTATLVPQAAIDPIAFFIVLVIVINIISGIANAARKARARAEQSTGSSQTPAARAAMDAAAARAAQRARLQQALEAIKSQYATSVAEATEATPSVQGQIPTSVAQVPSSSIPAATATIPVGPASVTVQIAPKVRVQRATLAQTPQMAPPPPASIDQLPPLSDSTTEMLTTMSLESTSPAGPQRMPPGTRLLIPGFRHSVTGTQLFIASAVIGPPAAFRHIGHNPAGW